ncbi:hypothetical protein [Peribacillus simplex]
MIGVRLNKRSQVKISLKKWPSVHSDVLVWDSIHYKGKQYGNN